MRATLLLALVAVLACSDDMPIPQFDGVWVGNAAQLELTLAADESDSGVITGDVQFDTFGFTVSGELTGRNNYPDISLKMAAGGYTPAYFTGSWDSPTVVTGTVDGSGFYGEPVTLVRR